jgi:Ca-activated chloride channel family protein
MFTHLSFEYPYAFVLLLLIICIYKCPLSIKEIIFPHTHLFTQKVKFIQYEKLLYSLILFLLITSLASPISYDSKAASKRKGRDLVFVLDASGSMAESGFNPEKPSQRKFDVLSTLLKQFILKRYDDNVGVAIFGSYAYSALPLSYDMKSIAFLLDFFDVGIAGESTAIGEGIARALEILKKGEAKAKVIILLSDGKQNSGSVSVKQAVADAKKDGVKIYTIGVGKAYDKTLLQKIANDTNAKMFEAKDAAMLENIYNELNRLEPSKIRSKHYLNKKMLFIYPLSLAILLMAYLLYSSKEEQIL